MSRNSSYLLFSPWQQQFLFLDRFLLIFISHNSNPISYFSIYNRCFYYLSDNGSFSFYPQIMAVFIDPRKEAVFCLPTDYSFISYLIRLQLLFPPVDHFFFCCYLFLYRKLLFDVFLQAIPVFTSPQMTLFISPQNFIFIMQRMFVISHQTTSVFSNHFRQQLSYLSHNPCFYFCPNNDILFLL